MILYDPLHKSISYPPLNMSTGWQCHKQRIPFVCWFDFRSAFFLFFANCIFIFK